MILMHWYITKATRNISRKSLILNDRDGIFDISSNKLLNSPIPDNILSENVSYSSIHLSLKFFNKDENS